MDEMNKAQIFNKEKNMLSKFAEPGGIERR